jgi:hypothetical protein
MLSPPRFDETLTFEKDAMLQNSRVILTDGGIYDNLRLGFDYRGAARAG